MFLEIVTPEKKIFSDEIRLLQVPGSKGSFEILSNHSPIISTLERGKIRIIDKQNQEVVFDIEGGVVECLKNKIILLAETL